jgi:amino acid transporter
MSEAITTNRVRSTIAPRRAGRPGLRREIGFIGLLWVSGGSIIGSGWLFGAQGALATAGPAAVISWVIGAVAILMLALVHAELGAMYPVAGGTARFPHYAFGGAVGASFGWFSWLQAATVAPIEVMAVIQYGQHYSFASGWMKMSGGEHVLTTSGVSRPSCSWRSLPRSISSASASSRTRTAPRRGGRSAFHC